MEFLNTTYYLCQKVGSPPPMSRFPMENEGDYEISKRRISTGEKEEVGKNNRVLSSLKVPFHPILLQEVSSGGEDILCWMANPLHDGEEKIGSNTSFSRISKKNGRLVRQYARPQGVSSGATEIQMVKGEENRFVTKSFQSEIVGVYDLEKSDPLESLNINTERISTLKTSKYVPSTFFVGTQGEKLIVYDLFSHKTIRTSSDTDLNIFGMGGNNMNMMMPMEFSPLRMMHRMPRPEEMLGGGMMGGGAGGRKDGGIDVICEVDNSRVLIGTGTTIKLYDWKSSSKGVCQTYNIGIGMGTFLIKQTGCVYHDNKFMVIDSGGSRSRFSLLVEGIKKANKLKIFDIRKPSEIWKTIEMTFESDAVDCTGISNIQDSKNGETRIMTTWNGTRATRIVQTDDAGPIDLSSVGSGGNPSHKPDHEVGSQCRIYSYDGDLLMNFDEGKGKISCLSICEDIRSIGMKMREDRVSRVEFLREEVMMQQEEEDDDDDEKKDVEVVKIGISKTDGKSEEVHGLKIFM